MQVNSTGKKFSFNVPFNNTNKSSVMQDNPAYVQAPMSVSRTKLSVKGTDLPSIPIKGGNRRKHNKTRHTKRNTKRHTRRHTRTHNRK
jgi:hypothetical protein